MSSIDFSAQFGGRDAAAAVLKSFKALKLAAKGITIDGFAADAELVCADKGKVGDVTVGLLGAAEVGRNNAFQARRGAADVPREDGVASGTRAGPQVSEFGLPLPGTRYSTGVCQRPPALPFELPETGILASIRSASPPNFFQASGLEAGCF